MPSGKEPTICMAVGPQEFPPTTTCVVVRVGMSRADLVLRAVQGVMIMASASTPDMAGATNSKGFYQGLLAESARKWAACSNDGEAVHGDGKAYCRCVLHSAWPFALYILVLPNVPFLRVMCKSAEPLLQDQLIRWIN